MDLQTFHQKANDIVSSYKLSKIFTGVDVTWCLQSVGPNDTVCTCAITAVNIRNQYIHVKEVTPGAALSVFESKVAELAESKTVASSLYFNQKPAEA